MSDAPNGVCELSHGSCLGYWGDIQLMRSSCCDAEFNATTKANEKANNFCTGCGMIAVLAHHSVKRGTGCCSIDLVWQDDEDGSLWRCSECGGEIHTAWTRPRWCAVCGRPTADLQ